MTLAISANASNFHLGKVALSITGATGRLPVGSAIYTSAFPASATYDSWTGGTDSSPAAMQTTYFVSNYPLPGYVSGATNNWSSDQQYLARTVTGLTIGHIYTLTVLMKIYAGPSSALLYLGVDGIGAASPSAVNKSAYTTLTYTFTATATSHSLRIRRTNGTAASFQFKSATLQRYSTATGTATLTRTDANGAHFVRLTESAAPNSSGAMTADDYEAAYGLCTYRVIDAAGNQATTTVTPYSVDPTADPVQIVAVGTSSFVGLDRLEGFEREFEYRETGSTLAILGRSGPVITTRSDNQWTLRQGTLTYYAADQAEADTIVGVYKASRVVLVRTSADFADMYHVASSVALRAGQLGVDGWSYRVEVNFQEVQWPEGYLAGDAWTYTDLTDLYLAYFDLPAAYATYALMASG